MNPEQEQLIAKAQDSLKAARVLANERLYSFAISRAYYTMLSDRLSLWFGGWGSDRISPLFRRIFYN